MQPLKDDTTSLKREHLHFFIRLASKALRDWQNWTEDHRHDNIMQELLEYMDGCVVLATNEGWPNCGSYTNIEDACLVDLYALFHPDAEHGHYRDTRHLFPVALLRSLDEGRSLFTGSLWCLDRLLMVLDSDDSLGIAARRRDMHRQASDATAVDPLEPQPAYLTPISQTSLFPLLSSPRDDDDHYALYAHPEGSEISGDSDDDAPNMSPSSSPVRVGLDEPMDDATKDSPMDVGKELSAVGQSDGSASFINSTSKPASGTSRPLSQLSRSHEIGGERDVEPVEAPGEEDRDESSSTYIRCQGPSVPSVDDELEDISGHSVRPLPASLRLRLQFIDS